MTRRSALVAALLAVALAAAPASGAAEGGCVVPKLVGVSYAAARTTLARSGCAVHVSQLPGHGRYTSPSHAEPNQLVGAQSPSAGSRAGSVTIELKPLCAQAELPAPPAGGAVQESAGPAELVVGMYLTGGPRRWRTTCATPVAAAGTLTITTAAGGAVTTRAVRAGKVGVFPLRPGRYVVAGVLAPGGGAPTAPLKRAFTIAARHTTRVNLIASEG